VIRLTVVRGREQGKELRAELPERREGTADGPAGPSLRIGRAADADLCISDEHLSTEHGRILWQDEQLLYRDLRSTNGSRLQRGEAVHDLEDAPGRQLPLQDGDRLLLGAPAEPVVVEVRLELPRAAAGPEPGERLIAATPMGELPAVVGRIERDPVSALALYQVAKRLGGQLELADVLDGVASAVLELLPDTTHVTIFLEEDGPTERLVPAYSRSRVGAAPTTSTAGADAPIRFSRAVVRRVVQERAAMLVANATQEFGGVESVMAARILSVLAVPLFRGEQIRGVLQADNRASAGMFQPRELELLSVLASQATLAIENARLHQRLRNAEERLRGENLFLKGREEKRRFPAILGDSAPMRRLFAQLDKVIDTRATVCIEGETGTGKELVASAIHYQGRRRDKLFIAQNCAAVPETLLESELFGHRRGAFTGADYDKKGLFELADGGTLFLDEVGEMSLGLQAKILRALQEGEIRPVGANQAKKVDVRILCATNRSLQHEVERGAFRQDLYYRLMVFPLRVPPLRERREDIPLLVDHFVRKYAAEMGRPLGRPLGREGAAGVLSPEALERLVHYPWPGNVRELQNELQRIVIQCDFPPHVGPHQLSPRIAPAVAPPQPTGGTTPPAEARSGTLRERMDQVERWIVVEALRENGGNKTRTAEVLGLTREGLHKKLARLGL
jgi:Nif-specific regulatory protein